MRSFQRVEGQNVELNKRLPRITQSVVCLLDALQIGIIEPTLDKTSRWVVSGSRLFNLMFGLPRAGKNVRGRQGCAKAAPLRSPHSCHSSGLRLTASRLPASKTMVPSERYRSARETSPRTSLTIVNRSNGQSVPIHCLSRDLFAR